MFISMKDIYKQQLEKTERKINLSSLNNIPTKELTLECLHWAGLYLKEVLNGFSDAQIKRFNTISETQELVFRDKYREVLENIPEHPSVRIPFLCSVILYLAEDTSAKWHNDLSEFVFMLDGVISLYKKHNKVLHEQAISSIANIEVEENSADCLLKIREYCKKIIDLFPEENDNARLQIFRYYYQLFAVHELLVRLECQQIINS